MSVGLPLKQQQATDQTNKRKELMVSVDGAVAVSEMDLFAELLYECHVAVRHQYIIEKIIFKY